MNLSIDANPISSRAETSAFGVIPERSFVAGGRARLVLAALFLVSAFSQIDRILPFILAEMIKADLSLSDTQIGLLTGIAFAVVYALLSLPLARASDRGSPRRVLVTCILIWSAMTGFGGLATSFLFLAVTRFGVALGEAGATPSAHALIARLIAPERRGLAIGIFSMGIPLGTMMGFALGGVLGDSIGWRWVLFGAGAIGVVIALLVSIAVGPTPPLPQRAMGSEPFLRASLRLLASSGFRWLFASAIAGGFAGAPFYAFAAPFLIRVHGLTTGQAGISFGVLQGLMGILGTMAGGRWFDRSVRAGNRNLLTPPAAVFLIASVTMTAALFVPFAWLSVALLVPTMLSFSFLLPWSFGTGHLVAGRGNEAMASSLGMIGAGLLGPALGPLLVGVASDAAAASGIPGGLAIGLLIVPIASVVTGIVLLIANRRVAGVLRHP